MPTRSVSNDANVIAILTFDGVGEQGTVEGETRNITAYSITNNYSDITVYMRAEEELNKQRTFELTIPPGQTVSGNIPGGQRPVQRWTFERPFPRWDGINVQWKIPA